MTRRGFTLLEVLVALTLIVAISGAIFTFLWTMMDRRSAFDVVVQRDLAVGAMWSRLEDGLATTFVADAGGNPGVKGGDSSIRVLGRGASISPGAMSGVQFDFDAGAGSVSVHQTVAGEGHPETLGEGVQWVRFRYREGDEWKSAFDSAAAGHLPVAVEVSVWFGPPGLPPEGERDSMRDASENAPTRPADRSRIFVVPDGPVTTWKGGS